MTPEKLAELESAVTAAAVVADEAGGSDETLNKILADAEKALSDAKALSHDATKEALEKERNRQGRTEKEKAEYSLKKNAERLKALGGDPNQVLGDEEESQDDGIPDWYKKEKAKEGTKTSLQFAEGIQDNDQRELVIQYLSTRITPSGDPEEDFRLALAAASALKNKEILAEVNRVSAPRKTAAGGSAPASVEQPFTPTAQERVLMAKPYNLSKEKVIAARKKAEK